MSKDLREVKVQALGHSRQRKGPEQSVLGMSRTQSAGLERWSHRRQVEVAEKAGDRG